MAVDASNRKTTLERQELKLNRDLHAFTLFKPYVIHTHKNFQQVLVISENTRTKYSSFYFSIPIPLK